jgi:L-ascorbate metabolism protein UlaG (beta-lactamase superfamily)
MKLTKYRHACFTVQENDKVLVIDPGEFSTDFIAPENVVAVVITHEHPDHFDPERLAEIMDKNPSALVLAPHSISDKLEAFNHQAVTAGEMLEVEPFSLAFHGGQHATIHADIPSIENVGIVINDLIYYPGDSFTLPGQAIDTLLLPASAPWMKISEAINFLEAIKPRLAIPTHDAILSLEGQGIADRLLGMAAQNIGSEYKRLETSVEI